MNKKEKIIADFFVEREGNGILEYIYDIDFLEEGILDSLDLVTLATYIEQKTGVQLDVTNDATLSKLRKFETIVEMIG